MSTPDPGPWHQRIAELEAKLAQAERHAIVDEIAFSSANKMLVEAESARDTAQAQLANLVEERDQILERLIALRDALRDVLDAWDDLHPGDDEFIEALRAATVVLTQRGGDANGRIVTPSDGVPR